MLIETKDNQKELTLLVLKPEAAKNGFYGRILSVIERKGFKIIDILPFNFSKEIVMEQYTEYMGNTGIKNNILFSLMNGISHVVILSSYKAPANLRNLIGHYRLASAGTIRGRHMMSLKEGSVVHASDNFSDFLKDCRRLAPGFYMRLLSRVALENIEE